MLVTYRHNTASIDQVAVLPLLYPTVLNIVFSTVNNGLNQQLQRTAAKPKKNLVAYQGVCAEKAKPALTDTLRRDYIACGQRLEYQKIDFVG